MDMLTKLFRPSDSGPTADQKSACGSKFFSGKNMQETIDGQKPFADKMATEGHGGSYTPTHPINLPGCDGVDLSDESVANAGSEHFSRLSLEAVDMQREAENDN